jgi:DNA topoisomerase I
MVKQMQRLRRGDTAEGMTLERGLELLAGRRAWEAENGPSPKKSRKKQQQKQSPVTPHQHLQKMLLKKLLLKKLQRKQQPVKLRKPQRKVKRTQ